MTPRSSSKASATTRFDEPEISSFGRDISRIGLLDAQRSFLRQPHSAGARLPATMSMFSDEFSDRELALGMLRLADLGITDVEIINDEPGSLGRRLQLVHRAGDQLSSFAIGEESEGTRNWFALIGPVLATLRTGRILLLDEIDASLHPHLSAHLLALLQDPETNPLGAQLIFTTHDTSLLHHLNRDEVWLTEKGDDGATTLTALAEYGGDKVRRSTNLERAYLQGRFGAVPQVDQFALRHALGMAGAQ
jgi:hypothetical protein